jgi:hypothetical protein
MKNVVQFALGLVFGILSLFWLLSVLYKLFFGDLRKGENEENRSWLFSLGFSIIMLVLSLAALITAL